MFSKSHSIGAEARMRRLHTLSDHLVAAENTTADFQRGNLQVLIAQEKASSHIQ